MTREAGRHAFVLAFDGTDFEGWQQQGRGRTVQGVLEDGLSQLTGEQVTVTGAGRTDAGVHALAQVAHADLPALRFDSAQLRHRLNGVLPHDLRVRAALRVPDAFHARRDARGKLYTYRLRVSTVDCPLEARTRVRVAPPLDLAAMAEAARGLLGRHDFAALQSSGSSVKTTVRTIHRCDLRAGGPHVELFVGGDGFLRHMVRTLAACLLEVGSGRHEPAWILDVLAARDRAAAAATAPARGLVLLEVHYTGEVSQILAEALSREHVAR